jgi:hypothetical protein
MKLHIVVGLVVCSLFTVHATEFFRNMPDAAFLKQLSGEKVKNFDAVVILKEQSLNIQMTNIDYRGYSFYGPQKNYTRVTIVKLLNEAAVERFGSFEYVYFEPFGDDIPCGFEARARVQKEDGTMWEMPETEVKLVVDREGSDGTPITRKALFKIPNLAPGDALQIEFTHSQPFSYSSSGIFYYNDRDPVLFSNLSITLPADDDARYYSFPEEKVGAPQISQVSKSWGAGKTYFWSVKNLNRIPNEPYARTFADQSMMTAFVVDERERTGFKGITDWTRIAKSFHTRYLNEDDVSKQQIQSLGFSETETDITIEKLDKLYRAMRKMFVLSSYNSLYPLSRKVSSLFEKKKGDASDLAYIMYRILRQWKQDVNAVWIRYRREGVYENLIPSREWFNRMGVLVRIGEKEKLYDFDRSIPAQYELPSFLRSVFVVVVNEQGCTHKQITTPTTARERFINEKHLLDITPDMNVRDTVSYVCNGAAAEYYRRRFYELDADDMKKRFKDLATTHCLSEVDTLQHNDLMDEPSLKVTYVGKAKVKAEQVEGFLTIKPRNHALKTLRDRLYSATRYNDVMLDEPFTISLEWTVKIPQGYTVHSTSLGRTVYGPRKALGKVAATQAKDAVTLTAEISFPDTVIPFDDYARLIRFLDDVTKEVEKDIVLKRI